MTNSSDATTTPTTQRASWRAALEIALIFVVFFLHGAWPTPDVNETNYVVKALRYWDQDTHPGDFFLGTADAHAGYYWAFGWLTLWLPLDAAAWVGRIVTWLLLAIAWRGLSVAIIPRPWIALLSAELFVMLTEQAHMAGEWVVGGVEGKGFAYAFVFWALQALVRGKWNLAWILLGPAVSLHAVVGVWAMVCMGIVWLASWRQRPTIAAMLPGLVIGLLLAAPGLWFGIMLNRDVDAETAAQAATIQVFERLPHHLQPNQFRIGYLPRHLLLGTLFLVLCGTTTASESDRRLRWFVGAAMMMMLAGLTLACLSRVAPKTAAGLLRFYWFRFSDSIVPVGVALVGLQHWFGLRTTHQVTARWWLAGLFALSTCDLAWQLRHIPGLSQLPEATVPRSDKAMAYDDWRDICQWAAEKTPPGSVFITPRQSTTFKWYTRRAGTDDLGRGEVATWKDMPQDAKSIVGWRQRLQDIFGTGSDDPKRRWYRSLSEAGVDHLKHMAAKYGAQYAIVELHPDLPQLPLKSAYKNTSYAVYDLRDEAK